MMVFVNDLAGVSNIPSWMKHVAADFDGMTFVDVVFPAFLFIVGMAIPFAVENRLQKDKGIIDFWKHVLIRTVGLLVLGIYMVNSEEMNSDGSLLPKFIWAPLLYIAAVLIWNRYPKVPVEKKKLYLGLQLGGLLILVTLYFTFRKGPNENLINMTTSWWGILGLIGWAYFYSMILYMLFKRRILFVGLILVMLGFIHILINYDKESILSFLNTQNGHICHTFIVIAGVLCALLLKQGGVRENSSSKILKILGLGIGMCLIAYLARPHTGGISKIFATPSWALYCSAICCFLFSFFYWLVDIKGYKNWGNFLRPAGVNPLLTYIIPYFIYAIIGFNFYPEVLSSGVLGFVRSIVFTLFILWLAKILTSRGVVLKL